MTSSTHSLAGAAGYPDLGRLPYSKAAVFCGTARYPDVATHVMVDPGRGKTAIITHLVDPSNSFRTILVSPDAAVNTAVTSFLLIDSAGNTRFTLPFLCFDRHVQTFSGGTSPGELSGQPDRPLVWRPRHPIVVPAGWKLTHSTYNVADASAAPHGAAAYGYVLDEYEALMMGFDCRDVTPSPGSGVPQVRWIQSGLTATNGTTTLAAARTGYTIQILEVFARLQPKATGGAALILKDGDGNTIFNFKSDNRQNQAEWAFSPGLYLRPGKSLTLTGDAQSAGRGTVVIIGRYVANDEVPGDAWYSYTEPAFPSPGTDGFALLNLGRSVNTVVTMTYPRTDTTRQTAGVGLRHHVEGYVFSGSKDGTVASDLVVSSVVSSEVISPIALLPGFQAASISPGAMDDPIMPILAMSTAHQDYNLAVSGLNIPCRNHPGKLVFASVAIGQNLLSTPTGTTNHIDGWSLTLWGRTQPSTEPTSPNVHMQGTEA